MKKLKFLLKLFLIMFKIGLFTFGGGYAMIAVMQKEFVDKRKYIDKEEFLDLISIAESTPGPLAINSATYIGYKKGGVLGSLFCTLGVVLPSFIIIVLISLFFEAFISLKFVDYAFKGIQVAVSFIILFAGIKMFLGLKKTAFNFIITTITVIAMVVISLLSVSFSSIYFILIGGLIGLIFYVIMKCKDKKSENQKENELQNNNSAEQGEGGNK